MQICSSNNSGTIEPDSGKVILSTNGKALLYKVQGHDKRVPVKRVYKLEHEAIAISIPFMLWDEDNPTLGGLKSNLNPDFEDGIEDLHDEKGVEVVILFCRSGGRITGCVTKFSDVFDKFSAVYEIDDPEGNPDFGGFEGSSYNDMSFGRPIPPNR